MGRRTRPRPGAVAAIATASLLATTVVAGSQASAAQTGAQTGTRSGAPSAAPFSTASVPAKASPVVSGDARFEVLSPTLIRTEYAGDAAFLDAATFNAVGRDGFAATPFTRTTSGGWLTVTTAALTLRYKVGSGPFTDQNLTIRLRTGRQDVTAAPWKPTAATTCVFGAVCEGESGTLGGGAALKEDHNDFSGPGFVAGLAQGASDTVRVTRVPAAGSYRLQVRYSNAQAAPGTISVKAGSAAAATVKLPVTSSWDSWRTVAVPVKLAAGTNDVTLGCPGATSCQLNVDTVAVTTPDSAILSPHAPLGGYRRSLDRINGSPRSTPGLLYQDGWSLLDDTASAVFDDASEKVTPRPGHGGAPYQDGYVFGYGHDYQRGLADLATLTGPSKLLPRWAYGVWYSEYYDRSAADYENTIVPKFRADGVPLDVLVTDTDFKSPDRWDGWEIDPAKFPDPKAFFDWSAAQGLHNTLNIHPSILSSDPQFAQAQATARNKLTKNNAGCYSDLGHGADCYTFDFGDPNQLKAYLDLHQTMEKQGADFWWLDWCCEKSLSTLAGVTPDAWINEHYAADSAKTVGRGFAFSRAYGSLQSGSYAGRTGLPTGPWADKRTTVHFTGDTISTWPMLQAEIGYTPGESAATGLSAVSHDIGGFNNDGTQAKGAEPGSTKLPDDLYARWVQLGTFQPIDRLHSNHSDRLPWQYGTAAKTSAEKFLSLREALVPYTYTLAEEARRTGVPVTRPAYLAYPEEQDAYATAGGEYLYGSDVLVAPVATPGTTAVTSVWFPPGRWTDWFTGRTYQGGTTQKVTTDLNSMPVFVKAGGIVPTRTGKAANDVQNPLTKVTLTVPTGAAGAFSLYEDDGVSTGGGKSATTAIRYAENDGVHTLKVSPVSGSFSGQVEQRTWTAVFAHATAPTAVTVNGATAAGGSWSWNASAATLTVTVPARSVHSGVSVSYR